MGKKLLPEPATPKEPGVSAVTFNAVKHGIFSVSPVIPWFEDEEDWYAFRDSIFESLQPRGGLEQALADRAATLMWRLMRIVRYERESVAASLSDVGRDLRLARAYGHEEMPKKMTAKLKGEMDRMAMRRLLPDELTVNKIMRYEARLHRFLLQTLNHLSLLKGAGGGARRPSLGVPELGRPADRQPQMDTDRH
jgi:hypothetical protein